MDKDSIILKYEQNEIKDIDSRMGDISSKNDNQNIELSDMQDMLNCIYASIGKKPRTKANSLHAVDTRNYVSNIETKSNFVELYEIASCSLADAGIAIESIDYHDLVSEQELREIENTLNRPMSERERWNRSDFIVVFMAATLGSFADIVLGDRNNRYTGKNSDFSKKLNKLHNHKGGDPLDYQGNGFGGGYHRGLSKSHDLLRFIEAIMMIKNGEFVGVRYEYGQAINVIARANQYGTPYGQMTIIESILQYAQHMLADLFSKNSLPFLGHSFLVECDNRQLRVLAANMYKNGFNCKNVLVQSITTVIIESIIRIHYSINDVRAYKKEVTINDDYSNYEAIKRFFKPINQEKLNEMLLVAHAICTAINVGKIVIKKSPWEINVTEIISVVRYGIKVLQDVMARNSEYSKLIRNSEEIHNHWAELENQICIGTEEMENSIKKMNVLVI